MAHRTAPPRPRTEGGGMTIRVYTVDRHGTVTDDRGTRTVSPCCTPLPVQLDTKYPPCQCPRHRPAVGR
ncbi:MAG TPA: hypothetical protein VFQ05_06705 [Candidatus Eisenbacteria bacterium]|nr:hypothetical protein [Candidatus Eisenbacteria bacterium]